MISPELTKKLLDAVAADDGKAALAAITEVLAVLAAGGAAPAAEPAASGADPLAAAADPAAPKPEDEKPSALSKALGFATDAEAAAEIKRLQGAVAKQTADTEQVELSARRELVGDLVKLGAELPAFAWEPRAKDTDPLVPAKRLCVEPIESLRARVVALKKAKPEIKSAAHEAPESGTVEIKLSKAEQDYCTKHGLTKEQFAAKRAATVRSAK